MRNTLLTLPLICSVAFGGLLPGQQPESPTAPSLRSANQPAVSLRTEGHDVIADGVGYRADFSRDGARMQVAGDTPAELSLRFVQAVRAGQVTDAVAGTSPERAGALVQYRHHDILERYEPLATGFEQTFVLEHRPEGSGDLVLSIAVDGDVHAPAFAKAHRAITFARNGVPAIRYGEAIAFDRRGTRVDVETSYDGAGGLRLHVPATFLDAATYPVVVDPIVGSALLPAGWLTDDSRPDVAYDPENDTYLVVWERKVSASTRHVYGRLYNRDGSARTPTLTLTQGPLSSTQPAVAWIDDAGQTGFALVFVRSNKVMLELVDGDTGALKLVAMEPVSSPAAGEVDARPVVSGPGAAIVAWDRTSAGASNPDRIMMRGLRWGIAAFPAYVTASSEKVVSTVTSGGHVRAPALGSTDIRPGGGSIAFRNRIAWERFWTAPAPGDYDLMTASFDLGLAADTLNWLQPPSTLADANAIGVDERVPSIGAIAEQHTGIYDVDYCIAWQDDNDVVARRYDINGPVGNLVTVRATPDFEGAPVVAAGACEFTIGYLTSSSLAVDVRAAVMHMDGTLGTSFSPVDTGSAVFQSDLAAASLPARNNVLSHNRTMLAWRGMTGPTGGTADVHARFFEPIGFTSAPYGSPCPGPAGELPTNAMLGDAYAGSQTFGMGLSNAPANSLAVLIVSDLLIGATIPGAPGCNLYAGLPALVLLPEITDASGAATANLPLPCGIPGGTTLAFQWGIYTPGHNAFGWIVSNDIDVNWNH